MALKQPWYYTRQATIAQARQAYFANKGPSTPGPIEQRGASTTLYYRSLALRVGAEPMIFSVNVSESTLALVTAAELGLKTTLGAGEAALRLRGTGIKPSRVHWYKGETTPVRTSTPWGSSVSRYYENSGGQSHYSAPFSQASGAFTAADLFDDFEAIFGTVEGSKRAALLGTKNGRAWLELERAPMSFMT
ncbi:hypothetical protein [Phormidium sp. FACHB-1136]|uniref:hypothetical protein n=1 Tax=Phormidium sp. FACHB-1136 TaxID=2692848 RepID=UPI0016830189|nr:hypothetical protein [Phormidium sp. FACHB-1136]MBD2425260.1 hypothetical protein [Phormidium sp. FACHB-1136]